MKAGRAANNIRSELREQEEEEEQEQAPGGFLTPGLLSPPPSSVTSTAATQSASGSTAGSVLPTPRRTPLKAGSPKETAFINYVDRGIQQIARRYAKKFTEEDDGAAARGKKEEQRQQQQSGASNEDAALGYRSFSQAARDIARMIDVVWVSGTPSLQVPYLLSLAMLIPTYLPSFRPAPRATVNVLEKLDAAFENLLTGGGSAAGFWDEAGNERPGRRWRGLNATEKVRMKGIVERTRVVAVEVMHRGEFEYEEARQNEDVDDTDTDDNDFNDSTSAGGAGESDGMDVDDTYGRRRGGDWDLEIARVYERTLGELGDTLTGPEIGIPSG